MGQRKKRPLVPCAQTPPPLHEKEREQWKQIVLESSGERLLPPWVIDDRAGAACQGWMQGEEPAARHGCRERCWLPGMAAGGSLPSLSPTPACSAGQLYPHVVDRTATQEAGGWRLV